MLNETFKLEDDILDCWRVVDDIRFVSTEVIDGDTKMSEDELVNIMLGLEQIYERRFQKLWNSFVGVLEAGKMEKSLLTEGRYVPDYEPEFGKLGPNEFPDDEVWTEDKDDRMNIIGQNGNDGLHYGDNKEDELKKYHDRLVDILGDDKDDNNYI